MRGVAGIVGSRIGMRATWVKCEGIFQCCARLRGRSRFGAAKARAQVFDLAQNVGSRQAPRAPRRVRCRCGEMADAGDLKSPGLYNPCGFESRHRHSSPKRSAGEECRRAVARSAKAGRVRSRRCLAMPITNPKPRTGGGHARQIEPGARYGRACIDQAPDGRNECP